MKRRASIHARAANFSVCIPSKVTLTKKNVFLRLFDQNEKDPVARYEEPSDLGPSLERKQIDHYGKLQLAKGYVA